MSISDRIQISISLFTFFAVIVALFGQRIRLKLFGPRIIIEFNRENERCFRWATVLLDRVQDQNKSFKNVKRQYFRLRVSNQGCMVARKLKAKVEFYFSDKSLADRFEPSALRWVPGIETIDLLPKEDEYLNLISQVIDPKLKECKFYKLRIELANKALRGIAWDRDLVSWILKVSIYGENIYVPIVKFFRFNPPRDDNQPGDLVEELIEKPQQ